MVNIQELTEILKQSPLFNYLEEDDVQSIYSRVLASLQTSKN